ncbi:MAG: serine/threonine-protein kinase [Kofleriaceae bacterium]
MAEPTPQPTMVGAMLGSYRVLAELSRGGMGTVYRAEHTLLGRPAAIKLLRPELTGNHELVQRFFIEAKAATAIRHPGIIEIYDFGYTDDGQAYLVMELLDGEPLGVRIATRGRLTETDAASIARGIASALKAAHGKGIVHRDLKPDNVFVVADPDGPTGERVKVLDFGIAKLADAVAADRHTQTGALMGTPMYMAPEQARAAGAIDHRADLYSLGCILYEMLVGTPPFVAEGAGEIIAMQMFAEPEPPSVRLVEIAPEMEQLVLRLLAKEPHDRPHSADEVVAVLASLGARLSTRLSAPLAVAESRPLRVTQLPTSNLPGDGPPEAPQKKSSLGLVAGIVTVVIAAGVVGVVALANKDGAPEATTVPAAPAPAPDPTPPIAIPTPTPPTPTTPTPATTPPAAVPVRVVTPAPGRAKQVKDGKRKPAAASSGPVTSPDGTTKIPDRVIEVAPKEIKDAKGPVTDQSSPIDNGEQIDVPRPDKQPENQPEPAPAPQDPAVP